MAWPLKVKRNLKIPLLLWQLEEKEAKARKKKTMAALANLTAPNPDPSESEDLSEAEQGVTAAILSTLKNKDGSPMIPVKKSESPKGPKTRSRATKKR